MKKILLVLIILVAVGLPILLPMPVMTSGLIAQYERGQSIELTVTVWNISPINKKIADTPHATDAVLKVDGKPIASTPTNVPHQLPLFSSQSQKLIYTVSKQESDTPRYDAGTGQLLLPLGKHKLSVEWLGSTSLGSQIRIIDL